ncbi:spore gernimation protein GerM [Candidatus Borreliella tachyglossi]|uniref:Spore gernimation protein GerM n=1 Tax=Candidatus Borreliella tachyglossi TaxID=1964448 RepID=A0A2S1LX55_9SPIR|nr:GerMN domain-containing protein [Candidatus Borreliella tachyglossi]AWG42879.1 spore gernimation protein GerM [Candidatus Borreliella tachyglossi]
MIRKKRNRRKKSKFNKIDIFLVLFAIFLTGLCLLLIIKNSLIKNIFNEQISNHEDFELNPSKSNRAIEAELDNTKSDTIEILSNEKFLIKPPEIQKIEEEFKYQQQKHSKNKKEVKLYFIKVTAEGHFLKQDVKRTIHYDKNILEETLKALINGPNEYELKNNFLSLIPINTKILTLSTNDGTAHINLSKEFYENSFGVEGTINQINQIILTCLEIQGINRITLKIENNPIILEDLNLDFSGILDKDNLE